MVTKVAETDKRNQTIAQLLQKEQQDNRKSENSKVLQLEARMEKQLMEFDIGECPRVMIRTGCRLKLPKGHLY